MVKLSVCPDCKSSEFVSANEGADSYYARMFWNVACRNPECQNKFWPLDKMPMCTSNFDTKEQAEEAWNLGLRINHSFSTGGRWTGD